MPRLIFYNAKIWLATGLVAGLVAVHSTDYGSMLDAQIAARIPPTPISAATVDEAVAQRLMRYDFARYQNVVDDSIFAVNAVLKKEPVVIKKPAPVPVKKSLPPPKVKPFTTQLEVTGIALTPERKLVMIWDKNKQQYHVLQEREKLLKWKVVKIDEDRVILKHERGKRYEFVVNKDTLTNF